MAKENTFKQAQDKKNIIVSYINQTICFEKVKNHLCMHFVFQAGGPNKNLISK